MTFLGDVTVLSDPASLESDPETLPLEGIIRRQIGDAIRGLRVAFPAAITAVEADQTVSVQPALQVRYAGRPPSNMPVIHGVPVIMPQGASYRASWPLAVGDTGLVLVADRSLDAWLAGAGGVVDPSDTRAHHLADALFLPGLVPSAKQTHDTGTDLVLGNGMATVRLKKNGHITVSNEAQEMVQVLHDGMQALISTLSALQSMQILTALGPAPVLASSMAQFAQIQATMTQILARLDTFKG